MCLNVDRDGDDIPETLQCREDVGEQRPVADGVANLSDRWFLDQSDLVRQPDGSLRWEWDQGAGPEPEEVREFELIAPLSANRIPEFAGRIRLER